MCLAFTRFKIKPPPHRRFGMITNYLESRQARRKQQKDQRKAIRNQEKLEEQVYHKIQHLLKNVFSENTIKEIAKKTGFEQREKKLKRV